MFSRIKQVLEMFDLGMLSEHGLALALGAETRCKSRLPASRRS